MVISNAMDPILGDSEVDLVFNLPTLCLCQQYQLNSVRVSSTVSIRESVDSLYRDGTDA